MNCRLKFKIKNFNVTLSFSKLHPSYAGLAWAGITALFGGITGVMTNYVKHVKSYILSFAVGFMGLTLNIVLSPIYADKSLIYQDNWNIDMTQFGQLIAMGLVGCLASWTTTIGYQLLNPSFCSVIRSTEVVFAYLVQVFYLSEPTDFLSIAGMVLIVGSGILLRLEKYVISILKKCFHKLKNLVTNANILAESESNITYENVA